MKENPMVERIVEIMIVAAQRYAAIGGTIADYEEKCRTTLTTFQSDIRRDLIEEILTQLPVEPDYMAEDYFSKGREAYRLEIRTLLSK